MLAAKCVSVCLVLGGEMPPKIGIPKCPPYCKYWSPFKPLLCPTMSTSMSPASRMKPEPKMDSPKMRLTPISFVTVMCCMLWSASYKNLAKDSSPWSNATSSSKKRRFSKMYRLGSNRPKRSPLCMLAWSRTIIAVGAQSSNKRVPITKCLPKPMTLWRKS